MTANLFAEADLVSVAESYVGRWGIASDGDYTIAKLARLSVRLDLSYCRAIAACYEDTIAPHDDDTTRQVYESFRQETLRQFEAITRAGIVVRPWLRPGQPYRDSAHLRESVRRTGELSVFLTRDGHGSAHPSGFHPLRERSGVEVDGVELCHNDIYRAVHDVFGHVMFPFGFGLKGELLAALCQWHMYSSAVHPVLFTEHVAQICWYYLRPDLPTPPAGKGGRRYPEQKVFAFPGHLVAPFLEMFAEEPR